MQSFRSQNSHSHTSPNMEKNQKKEKLPERKLKTKNKASH